MPAKWFEQRKQSVDSPGGREKEDRVEDYMLNTANNHSVNAVKIEEIHFRSSSTVLPRFYTKG